MLQSNGSNTSVRLLNSKAASDSEVFSNSLEKELDLKIGLNHNDSVEKCKQLLYEYYLKAEDLESKCIMLHRNLQEVKDAWDKAKLLKDQAMKEKENMTLKFANGERKMLNEKELKEKAEKKCKALTKEIDSLQYKLHIQIDDKTRISDMYDKKIHELKDLKSENDRIKNENLILKNELKLCQIAIKNQVSLNEEAQNTIENLKRQVNCISEQKHESVVSDDMNESFRDLQDQLKKLELGKKQKEDELQTLFKSFNDLNSKYHALLIQNNKFSNRILELEKKLLKYEDLLGDIQNEGITSKAFREENNLPKLDERVNQLELENEELRNDNDLCRLRESETLIFNEKLSEKNVTLQSEISNFQIRVQELNAEKTELYNICKELKKKIVTLSEQLSVEKETNRREMIQISVEMESLKKNLYEQNNQNIKLKQQLFDQQGEINIMKKKHNWSLREFRKEMMICKNYHDDIRSSKSCSSTLSLRSTISKGTEQCYDHVEVIQPENMLNQNVLIERILRLQKINIRKSEKIDFLEDQIDLMFFELHKKRKLLQHYFLQEQTEALTSNKMDETKLNLTKFGGIMASLFESRISDENLTLELSLEINHKLQSVLEDVLLKNIILKENIEILGDEIEKLNKRWKDR